MKKLPKSKRSKFWGKDAELYLNKKEPLKMGKKHTWKQKGNIAICTSCPTEHGVFLDSKHEVVRGKIVKKSS